MRPALAGPGLQLKRSLECTSPERYRALKQRVSAAGFLLCPFTSAQAQPSSLQLVLGGEEMGAELVLLIPPHCFLLDTCVCAPTSRYTCVRTLPKVPRFSLVISALLPALALFRGYHSAEIWSLTPAPWLVALLGHHICLIRFQVSWCGARSRCMAPSREHAGPSLRRGLLLRSQLQWLGLFTSLCHCLSCLSAGCQGPSHSAAGSQPCWAFRRRLLEVRHVFQAELTVVFAFPLQGAGRPQEEQQTLAAHLLPEPGCVVAPEETSGPAAPCPRAGHTRE